MITTSAFEVASRFIGIKEIPGSKHNPLILAMFQLDSPWFTTDETGWCSVFANCICWILGLERSKSAAARSWLNVGEPIQIWEAQADSDIVVMKRGGGPGPEVVSAPGHVGFFADWNNDHILILGGNQGDQVKVAPFHRSNLLGIRRLAPVVVGLAAAA